MQRCTRARARVASWMRSSASCRTSSPTCSSCSRAGSVTTWASRSSSGSAPSSARRSCARGASAEVRLLDPRPSRAMHGRSPMKLPIYFKQLELGPMQNYVYLLGDPNAHEAAVVDAAWDVEAIVRTAESDGYRITKDLVTHFHPDHLGGSLMGHQIIGAAARR